MKISFEVNGSLCRCFWLSRLVCIGLLSLLSGCATNILHNSADFKTATEADEAAKKIDYTAAIQVERGVQQKVLDHELSVVDRFATARRDYALLNLIMSNKTLSVNLGDRITARQEVLTGGKMPVLTKIVIANLLPPGLVCGSGLVDPGKRDEKGVPLYTDPGTWVTASDIALVTCTEELKEAAYIYEGTMRFSAPVCPANGKLEDFDELSDNKVKGLVANYKRANPTTPWTDDQVKSAVRNAHNNYRGKCMSVRAHEAASRSLVEGCAGVACGPGASASSKIVGLNGQLVEARKQLSSKMADLLADKKAAQDAKDEYEAAQAAYTVAVKKQADDSSDATRKAVTDAGEKVGGALKLLSKAGRISGEEAAVKEQIAKIDQIMKAVSSGTYDKEAIKKACAVDSHDCTLAQATAVAAHLPSFIDRVEFITALSQVPPLSGLLLEKSRLLALKEQADKTVTRRNREIDLYENNMRAILDEVELLRRAQQLLTQAVPMTTDQFVSASTDAASKELLLRALAKYLLTFTGPKHQIHSNEYRLIALEHEAALDHSEASLKIWKASIDVPVAALLAYHQGGLKPEDIVELLKALGLGGIALGVNR